MAGGAGTRPAFHEGIGGASNAAGQNEHRNGVLLMDSDRIGGTVKEGIGKVKEEWGDATDNPRTEAEGQAEQAEGKLQDEWGKAKDTARDVADGDR
jgi:uncharacterized protein YjbJ (UPF0337 family)